jgi:VWFA-related protein
VVGLLIACAAAAPVASRPTAACQEPTFSSRSDVVLVHVTVRDRRGRLVPDLDRGAFAVHEEGTPQTVTYFSSADSPVTVGLVIDNSGSMMPKREAVIAAGLAFARASHPQDELFTINFADTLWPGLPAGVPFTSDLDVLRAALRSVGARGKTALYDAIDAALRHQARGAARKKTLIVISDGGDNASTISLDEVLAAARRHDALIYTIGLYNSLDRDARPGVLKQLARDTGGEAYFPDRVDETTGILERIALEIRRGYTLGYVPTNTALDGRYRRIRVVVSAPGQGRLKVRARAGYLAPSRGSHVP